MKTASSSSWSSLRAAVALAAVALTSGCISLNVNLFSRVTQDQWIDTPYKSRLTEAGRDAADSGPGPTNEGADVQLPIEMPPLKAL